jgi:hypothetical protein
MKPLLYGTLRHALYSVSHGADLLAGKPVVLSRELLASHFPRGAKQHPGLPASYDAESYLLTGNSTLTPLD